VLSSDDVRSFAATSLAAYKVPTYVELVDALPHTATGKVLKHLLGKDAPLDAGFIEE
jgi:long-chain acyl-CoA synthetase